MRVFKVFFLFLLAISGFFLKGCYTYHVLLEPKLEPKSIMSDLFRLKWRKYVGRKNWTFTCQPIIYGDRIYHATCGDEDGADSHDFLYAFDRYGNLLWKWRSQDGGNTDLNGVVVCRDYILVGCENVYAYAYAISHNGKLLWKFKTRGWGVRSFSLYDLNRDGFVDAVVGSCDNHIYAISGRDGKLLWRFKTGGDVYSSPSS